MPLRVATRASPLALWQATRIARALADHGADVQCLPMHTRGDLHQNAPIPSLGKDAFMREIEAALLAGNADLAVHSLKDMPRQTPAGLTVPAYCYAASVADVLLSPRGWALSEVPPGTRVGTSSPRRQGQLRRARADLVAVPMRGNVGTRLAKLTDGVCGAMILAQAGLDRLEVDLKQGRVRGHRLLAPTWMPAPGQGVLAVQCRSADRQLCALVAQLDDKATRLRVTAERACSHSLQADCHAPLGAYAQIRGAHLELRATVTATNGGTQIQAHAHCAAGALADAQALGTHVGNLLAQRGAVAVLAQATQSAIHKGK